MNVKPVQLTFEQFMQATEQLAEPSVVNRPVQRLETRLLEIEQAVLLAGSNYAYELIKKLRDDVHKTPYMAALYVPTGNSADVITDTTTVECLSRACKWVGPLQDCRFEQLGALVRCPICGNSHLFTRKSP